MNGAEFNAMKYANIKDPSRPVCEHCNRTYLQTLEVEGLGRSMTIKLQCDLCGELGDRLDKLARFGFDLRDQLRGEQGKRETAAGAKRIEKLEKMLEAQRADWAVAVRKAKMEIGRVRKENGKR